MGKLKILPANVANIIAAGEVVQRPSSVVKELMENAVDAGADRIDVIITDAGRTLIQVIDNGSGMSADDAVLCFERHATSKIAKAEDINSILTYGFRGEALPSIASVSEVTLKTRRKEDEAGTQVTVSEFGKAERYSVSCPTGTNICVRNLFFNTPARRKFLKSDKVELRHIIEEFQRVALTLPDICFSFTADGREIFVLKKAKSMKFRILDLMGSSIAQDIVDIEIETSTVGIHGFLGRPDAARKTVGNQFFFINGRFCKSPYLHKAVMNAYEEMMPKDLVPAYFLFLKMDPQSVDVNVSPTKTEVKFEDESLIFQILYAGVRETLGKNSFKASIDFETEGVPQMPQLGKSYEEYKGESSYNPFEETASRAVNYRFDDFVDKKDDYGKLFEESVKPAIKSLAIHGKYILSPAKSGLMVINCRRATERILYEQSLAALKGEGHVTQQAMFPVQVRVGAAQRLVFEEHAEMLSSLGFDIAPFGTDTVVVNGVPEGYSCEEGKIVSMVEDLNVILSDNHTALPEVLASSMAEKFAVLGSANAGAPEDPREAQSLVDALFGCENSELTASGKRIVAIIPIEEIDKRFQ